MYFLNKCQCFFLIGGLFLLLASCGQEDDAAAIRGLIREGAELAEKQDIGGLLNLATEDFRARPGDLKRRETRAFLWRAFRYYETFKIHYPRPGIELAEGGESARANVSFLILKDDHAFKKLKDLFDDPEAWLEEAGRSADVYHLDLELVKEGGEWLVRRAAIKSV